MKKRQEDKVMEYMQKAGSITQRDAIWIGVYRLSAVIFDLKKAGVRIRTEMVTVEKVDGTKTRVASYSLEESNDGE